MAAGDVARILRAPGRLVVNPTVEPATGTHPFGGVEVGKVNGVALRPAGEAYPVMFEGLGAIGDLLEADVRWAAACFLRGWDDDGVRLLAQDGYDAGEQTQHAVFSVPNRQVPGSSTLGRAVKVLFVPDDQVNVPGFILYFAVPDWEAGSAMAFQRGTELGLALAFECLRDPAGRVLSIGRLRDLEL